MIPCPRTGIRLSTGRLGFRGFERGRDAQPFRGLASPTSAVTPLTSVNRRCQARVQTGPPGGVETGAQLAKRTNLFKQTRIATNERGPPRPNLRCIPQTGKTPAAKMATQFTNSGYGIKILRSPNLYMNAGISPQIPDPKEVPIHGCGTPPSRPGTGIGFYS